MKNHRDVCSAIEVGFITFQGLPGKVKTGCQLTPDVRSRYCSKHKPHICIKPMDGTKASSKVDKEEDVTEMIIAEQDLQLITRYTCTLAYVIDIINTVHIRT